MAELTAALKAMKPPSGSCLHGRSERCTAHGRLTEESGEIELVNDFLEFLAGRILLVNDFFEFFVEAFCRWKAFSDGSNQPFPRLRQRASTRAGQAAADRGLAAAPEPSGRGWRTLRPARKDR